MNEVPVRRPAPPPRPFTRCCGRGRPSVKSLQLSVTRPTDAASAASRATVLFCIRPATSAGATSSKCFWEFGRRRPERSTLRAPPLRGRAASLPRPSPKDGGSCGVVRLSLTGKAQTQTSSTTPAARLHLACLQTGTLRIVEADRGRRGPDATNDETAGSPSTQPTVGALTDEPRGS